ncbi:MAG TPA: hypothetical protein VHP35_08455 [Terriglobia bacterium]|nr:hypothetical protein [Terriglobia bacterium]
MYPFQKMNNSLVRLAIVAVIGLAVAFASPFTVEAKGKTSKPALKEMIAGAKTAADHKAIADYYYAEAAKARAKAVEHDEMAGWYRKAGEGTKKTPYAPGTIDHCDRLVKDYKSTADNLTALAKEHEAMAAKVK